MWYYPAREMKCCSNHGHVKSEKYKWNIYFDILKSALKYDCNERTVSKKLPHSAITELTYAESKSYWMLEI